MRNFLLRGPAGTGKTEGARAIAAGLNLPYMKYTCSAGTEIFDLVGQVFPDTDGPSTGDADLDQQREQLKEMGGITYENVKKLMGLPDLDDMDYDPAGTYQKLSGMEKPDATSQDCMSLLWRWSPISCNNCAKCSRSHPTVGRPLPTSKRTSSVRSSMDI